MSHDRLALTEVALGEGAALCTIVHIDGSFSRRLGAQLAVRPDGGTVGDLADGCLEAALAADASRAREEGRILKLRYGKGSPMIDFKLPCGGGLDIVIDPAPDAALCADVVGRLREREQVRLALPMHEGPMRLLEADEAAPEGYFIRSYIPALSLLVLGAGPEPEALRRMARSCAIDCEWLKPRDRNGTGQLSLGRPPETVRIDPWTAILLLFHDHEWEAGLLPWALESPALLIGAQGGARARELREALLMRLGYDEAARRRVRSPVGLIKHARDAEVLALSVLAECVDEYETLMP